MPPAPATDTANQSSGSKPSWRRRTLNAGLMTLYCLAIFLALDFVYTKFIHEKDRSGRMTHDDYHHGLFPNFEGYESWGRLRERLYTNNLGFKDGQIREVPAAATIRRVLLIGDSFTEGIGLKFEDTFAGMLYLAGQQRTEKIEFLNAGVISYSPVIYYKKIKYLLEAGLRFDEVVVFSDLSDVQDEAISYFCIDDHREFRRHCSDPPAPPSPKPTLVPKQGIHLVPKSDPKLKDNLALTDRLLQMFWYQVDLRTGSSRRFIDRLHMTQRSGWTVTGNEFDNVYQPLGVEGGIKRSLANMQSLADLLRTRGIGLTVAVYPWPYQLFRNDRDSRQVAIWRDFCAKNCKQFINLFPVVFAERDANSDWYERLFIPGDSHYSPAGNRVLFRELAKRLM
jgi:hypothetical protein